MGGQAVVGHVGVGGGGPISATADILCVSIDGELGGLLGMADGAW